MLFAVWEVRIVKICDRGLENAASRPRAAFSSPRPQLFNVRINSKSVNNLFIFSKFSNKNNKNPHGDRGQEIGKSGPR